MNFEFKNEAARANFQENKIIQKWQLFWNKVYINLRTSNIIIIVSHFFLSFTKCLENRLIYDNWKWVPEVGIGVMKRADTLLGSSN